jgi:hypothetical protein
MVIFKRGTVMKLLTKFANITEITISFRFINIKDSASVNGEIVTKNINFLLAAHHSMFFWVDFLHSELQFYLGYF